MDYDLITPDEISALSAASPDEAFVSFENTCRSRLHSLLRDLSQDDSGADLYLQYMGLVAAAAEEYGVDGYDRLAVPSAAEYVYGDYRAFSQAVLKAVTRLQIRRTRAFASSSVQLESSDKEKILHHIRQLRIRVEESTLDDAQKKALYKKLESLETELTNERFNLTRSMILLTALFAAISQAESAIIKAPEAVAAIMQIVGMAKGIEESEQAKLPKSKEKLAIEDHGKDRRGRNATNASAGNDDIPF